MVMAFPGILPLVDLRPVESLGVGCDDNAMVPRLQGQEEFVRKGDGLVQPCLGDCKVDEQFLGRLEVLAVPGETTCLEEGLGSAYQRMPIWKLPPQRAFPPRRLVGRLREGSGPLRQDSVSRPLERIARTRFGEWRLLRRLVGRQLRPVAALWPRYVEQRADAGHVAGRDTESGCHPEHGLGPDHPVQCFSTDRAVVGFTRRRRYLRCVLFFCHDARSTPLVGAPAVMKVARPADR